MNAPSDQSITGFSRAPASTCERLAFSVAEAAHMLGISEKSVRRLVARGLLRPSRALRHLRIPRKEIERFLNDTVT
jgi:excisionase family DNA binding protein